MKTNSAGFFLFWCRKEVVTKRTLHSFYYQMSGGVIIIKVITCVVIGGGYAGINAVKAIRKEFQGELQALRLILIDKNAYHFRKVLLFKPTAIETEITVPLKQMFTEGVELVQAAVVKIGSEEKTLLCRDTEMNEYTIHYDFLVVAIGSILKQPEPDQGGIALTGLKAAKEIRETWRMNVKRAVKETNAEERQRLMTIAVAGAGISGIETSAELSHFVRKDAAALGLNPADVRICLVNAHNRLFSEGPAKVGLKLEQVLTDKGIRLLHGKRVLQEKDGILTLSNGERMPVGLCVWTLGLLPNPILPYFGLPLTPEGYVIADASYRVQGMPDIYCIGDCAQIVDPVSGHIDGKTCKEAAAQASRIGKILLADLKGKQAPSHKRYLDVFCFGLGPGEGMVWSRQWGVDIILKGKLGWRIRKFTWDAASLVK